MASPLTDQEKERVRYHLGFMQVQPAASIQLGLPAATQTSFLIENAMNNLLPAAVPRVQRILQTLDGIEGKLVEAQDRLAASQLGDLVLRGSEQGQTETDLLEREYRRWTGRLADIFGCHRYPYSERSQGGGLVSGAIPVRREEGAVARGPFTVLDPTRMRESLVSKLVPTADKVRDLATKFGLRPYIVRIVRLRWSGGTRGRGIPSVLSETAILPTPRVFDIASQQEVTTPVGLDEFGTITVGEISGEYTEEDLFGQDSAGEIPQDVSVFWEVEFPRPDGEPARKRRFTISGAPEWRPGNLEWRVTLVRAREERTRKGEV